MKKLVILILLLSIIPSVLISQIFTLQPGPILGIDSRVFNLGCGINVGLGCDTSNYGNEAFFQANAWTYSGSSAITRSFIKFDLSSIGISSANVTTATLSLYFPPDQVTYESQSNISGSNEVNVDRVVQSWGESNIKWSNQPSTVSSNLTFAENRVIIPSTTSSTQDVTIDITAMLKFWLSNPSQNYGMRLALATEQYYRRMTFATSDYSNANLRPKLLINYSGSNFANSEEVTNLAIIVNPIKNSISIKIHNFGNQIQFELFSQDGKLAQKQSLNNDLSEHNIPIDQLPFGIYILRISDENGKQIVRKIIINN